MESENLQSNLCLQNADGCVMQNFSPAHTKPDNIEQDLSNELKHYELQYQEEEDRFVEQMLVENPIVVERRGPTQKNSSGSEETLSREEQLRRQRAESCRKSRINNKINKAKTRYRHQFISEKYVKKLHMLEHLRNVISETESHLLRKGFDEKTLRQLRAAYGLDQNQTNEAGGSDQSINQ